MAIIGNQGSEGYDKLAIELAKLMDQAGECRARDLIHSGEFRELEISGRYREAGTGTPYKITIEAILLNGKTFTFIIISQDVLSKFCDLLKRWCRLRDDAEIKRAVLIISPEDIVIAELDLIVMVPDQPGGLA